MADPFLEPMQVAYVDALNADAALQGLTGKAGTPTDPLCVEWEALGTREPPIIALLMLPLVRGGLGSRDSRVGGIRLTIAAAGDGARALVRDIGFRAEQLFTQPMLAAAGIDARPEREPVWFPEVTGDGQARNLTLDLGYQITV